MGAPEARTGLRKRPPAARGRRAKGLSLDEAGPTRPAKLEHAPARLKAERERRRARNRRIAIVSLIAIAVLLVAGFASAALWVAGLENKMVVKKKDLPRSLVKAEPQQPYTILLLGHDQRKKNEPDRSDTIILAKVDPIRKKVWMLSIPRDTRVTIPNRGTMKINGAFNAPSDPTLYEGLSEDEKEARRNSLGAEGSIEAVRALTGIEINHYMTVNFEGFAKAVDAMGGVWIDVPVEINDREAASHTKGRTAHIDAGYQLLDGEHALTFVRARHQFADQDFSRMRNQQMFFKALADQVAKSGNLAKLPRVVSSVAPYLNTDMSLMEMIRTAQALRSAGSKSLYTETLPGTWRSPYIYLDETKKAELLAKFNAGESFVDEPEPAEGAATDSGAPSAKKPSEIRLAVRNGARIPGIAGQASSILKARGFLVGEVGNTKQPVYDETLIVYKEDEAAARLVATALQPGVRLVPSRGMYTFDADVLVVVGRDWDLSKVPVAPVKTN